MSIYLRRMEDEVVVNFVYFCAMKTFRVFIVSFLFLMLQGCELIEYHPYDARFDGKRDINAQNIERIEAALAGRDSICFAVISDTQRWYDETSKAVADINGREEIDFVIHCGDLTDFGATKEFEWMREELEKLRVPYVCLIGNHDCLANGADVFRAMFGRFNFSFMAGDTHFVCLNTNALEHDYSVPIPDFTFLRTDRETVAPEVRRTVVAMHAAPLTDQFNNNVSGLFHESLKAYPGLQFCVCGHEHATCVYQPLADGVDYYECGSAKKRTYLIFTLTREGGVRYETVRY